MTMTSSVNSYVTDDDAEQLRSSVAAASSRRRLLLLLLLLAVRRLPDGLDVDIPAYMLPIPLTGTFNVNVRPCPRRRPGGATSRF